MTPPYLHKPPLQRLLTAFIGLGMHVAGVDPETTPRTSGYLSGLLPDVPLTLDFHPNLEGE